MTPEVPEVAVQIVAAGAAATAAFEAGRRWLVPGFRTLRRGFQALSEAEVAFETMRKMAAEFRPNGGSSLRDSLNRIEERLSYLHGMKRAAFEFDSLAHFEADADGSCVWVNDEWTDLTGLDRASARGSGWLSGICEEDRARVRDEWASCVSEARNFQMRFRMRNVRDGTVQDVEVLAVMIRKYDGPMLGAVGVVRLADRPTAFQRASVHVI